MAPDAQLFGALLYLVTQAVGDVLSSPSFLVGVAVGAALAVAALLWVR